MLGYKVFEPDWTCRGFQYEVGKSYEIDRPIEICKEGFHFCTALANCFKYYPFSSLVKIATIEAYGDITTENNYKYCTDKIRILKELPWSEVIDLVNIYVPPSSVPWEEFRFHYTNTGLQNIGYSNSGDNNKGNCNTGKYNIGNLNNGNYNQGDFNIGHSNIGHRNKGSYNIGNWNTGDYNIGNWNTGYWNIGYYNAGCFNTIDNAPSNYFFNKPCPDFLAEKWYNNTKIINYLPLFQNHSIPVFKRYNFTEEEKKNHIKEISQLGGFLHAAKAGDIEKQNKIKSIKETFYIYEEFFFDIPNFDIKIFEEIVRAHFTK